MRNVIKNCIKLLLLGFLLLVSALAAGFFLVGCDNEREWEYVYLLTDYQFRVSGTDFFWNGISDRYELSIDRHDGNGFVAINLFHNLTSRRRISDINPTEGINTLRITCMRGERNNRRRTILRRFGYWNFEVQFVDEECDYDFQFDGSSVSWIGMNIRLGLHNVFMSNGYGFERVSQSHIHGNMTTRASMHWSNLGIAEGDNTLKVAIDTDVSYYDGIMRLYRRVDSWNLYFAGTEEKLSNYTFVVSRRNNSVSWDGLNIPHVAELCRNGNGFERIGTASNRSISLLNRNFEVGFSYALRVSSTRTVYEGGIFSVHVSTAYWEFGFVEKEETVLDYYFEVNEQSFRWNGRNVFYEIYVANERDPNAFRFSHRAEGNSWSRISSLRFLEDGKNTIRIKSSFFDYDDGILSLNQNRRYWTFELSEETIYKDYNFEIEGATFRWNGDDVFYRVYVKRANTDSFWFTGETHGQNARALSSLSLSHGINVVRIIATHIQYENGLLRRELSVGHWHVLFSQEEILTEYHFSANGMHMEWSSVGGNSYRVYVNRHDGQGFDFVQTSFGGGINHNMLLDDFGLTLGKNTIRIENYLRSWSNPNVSIWVYDRGILRFGRRVGYWTFELVEESFSNDYLFGAGNDFWGNKFFRFTNASFVDYRVYVDRHNGKGFDFALNARGNSNVAISELNLTKGLNTVRVVSTASTWRYQNGIMTNNISIRYWNFEYQRDVFLEQDYQFTVPFANMFSFDGHRDSSYRAYHSIDGVNFVFVRELPRASRVLVRFSDFNLGKGKNTIRVVCTRENANIRYSNSILKVGRTIGHWDFYLQETEFVGKHDFRISNGVIVGFNEQFGGTLNLRTYHSVSGDNFNLVMQGTGTFNREIARIPLQVGTNFLKLVTNEKVFDYQNGVLFSGIETSFWEIYVEFDDYLHDYDFRVTNNRQNFTWNSNANYKIYVKRGDSSEFVYLVSRQGSWYHAIGLLNLEEGKNIVKVIRHNILNSYFYFDGTLLLSRYIGKWEIYFSEKNEYIHNYYFSIANIATPVLHAFFMWEWRVDAWDFLSVDYRVYLDRHDGNGLNFVQRAGRTPGLHMKYIQLERGFYTIRVESERAIFGYSNGKMRYGISVGIWDFYFSEEDFMGDYNFKALGCDLIFDGMVTTYSVYIDRHDGDGFVFATSSFTWINGVHRFFSRFGIVSGSYTIRVQTDIHYFYQNGVLKRGKSYGYWEFYVEKGRVRANYVLESGYPRWGNDVVTWDGACGVVYEVFKIFPCGNYEFAFSLVPSINAGINIYWRGEITIRVEGFITSYQDGFLKITISYDYLSFYVHEDGTVELIFQ
ncbi:MAG: hypothetical protein FWC11_04635 [Firmicutes bacterium]|nr:hypothetical protein [Bacillota bacterium]